MAKKSCRRPALVTVWLPLWVLVLILNSVGGRAVYGVDFEYSGISGSFDTTLSWGQNYRISDRDADLIGIANGGRAFSVNADDGNLNYDPGLISNAFLFTSELEAHYKNFSVFVRGTGFHDTINSSASQERTRLSREARDLVGEDLRLLDAYLSSSFQIGRRPAELRIGEQVVSWGESTFIQNGINVINPFDVSKLRVPGAELREALLPVGMIWGNLGLTRNLSVEAFYQFDFEMTELEPAGSYFSTNDFVADGGEFVMLGFGGVPDFIPAPDGSLVPTPSNITGTPPGVSVPRGLDRRPQEGGQYGITLRAYLPELNHSELGFHFINYHSRLPVVNATTGTAAAALTPNFAASSRYFISYPEDIKLFGLSFNTELGNTGVALQGEFSHKLDQPLQVDDAELLFAALGAQCPTGGCPFAPLAAFNQIGVFGPETDIPGFIRRNVSQFQLTATKILGPVFKADQGLVLGEIGITHVHNMPDKDTLRLDGPGTFISGNQTLAAFHAPTAVGQVESSEHFADATSWGYRVIARLDYNNAIGAINLQPHIAWLHDVNGITPAPLVNFLEDRKAVTFGVRATYLGEWEVDLSYTDFFGAGRHNLLNDRDFTSFIVRYSF